MRVSKEMRAFIQPNVPIAALIGALNAVAGCVMASCAIALSAAKLNIGKPGIRFSADANKKVKIKKYKH
jgi:hypothetical protein